MQVPPSTACCPRLEASASSHSRKGQHLQQQQQDSSNSSSSSIPGGTIKAAPGEQWSTIINPLLMRLPLHVCA